MRRSLVLDSISNHSPDDLKQEKNEKERANFGTYDLPNHHLNDGKRSYICQ